MSWQIGDRKSWSTADPKFIVIKLQSYSQLIRTTPSHWRWSYLSLYPSVSKPSLQPLTVCLHLALTVFVISFHYSLPQHLGQVDFVFPNLWWFSAPGVAPFQIDFLSRWHLTTASQVKRNAKMECVSLLLALLSKGVTVSPKPANEFKAYKSYRLFLWVSLPISFHWGQMA